MKEGKSTLHWLDRGLTDDQHRSPAEWRSIQLLYDVSSSCMVRFGFQLKLDLVVQLFQRRIRRLPHPITDHHHPRQAVVLAPRARVLLGRAHA